MSPLAGPVSPATARHPERGGQGAALVSEAGAPRAMDGGLTGGKGRRAVGKPGPAARNQHQNQNQDQNPRGLVGCVQPARSGPLLERPAHGTGNHIFSFVHLEERQQHRTLPPLFNSMATHWNHVAGSPTVVSTVGAAHTHAAPGPEALQHLGLQVLRHLRCLHG